MNARHSIMTIRIILISLWLTAGTLEAAQSSAKINSITEHLQVYRHDWTAKDTQELLKGASGHGMQFTSILADDGNQVKLTITGDTVLVEGKDISGNLGSKTTTGANSPIIEDVRDSQIATGDKSSATNTQTTNYTLSISLSVALSVSIALNAYLLRRASKAGSGGKNQK